MRCFYCSNIINTNELIELNSSEHHHLFKTLRGKTGELVEIIDGRGTFAVAEITENKNLKIKETAKFPEPATKLILFLAPPKKQKMDQLLKQCSEIGVWEIVPILTQRSVSTPTKKNTLERWNQMSSRRL